MKTRNILTAISVLMLVLACVKEEHQSEGTGNDNFIKVNMSVPEIEVKASSAPVFYAHIPSQLQDGNVNPIAETVTNRNDGSKYYNLPIGTSAVAFTNLYDNTGAIDISADEVGNVWYSVDTEATKGSYFFSDEILAGYVSDVVPGTSEPYEVQIKRLSSKMTTYFRVKNENGADLDHDYIIKTVSVEYSCIGGSASILADGTVAASGSHKQKVDMTYPSWYYYSHESNFIPTSEVPEVKVVIERESGMIQSYTASLGKVLEPNHHYTINLSVTNVNGGASFILNEPEVVVSSPITPEVTDSEFFSTASELTIGGAAGDELLLDISTILPYEWTFEFDEISENYFTGEIVDGKLKLVTKEGNMGDIRYGNVILKSSVGNYTKVLNIRQMSAIKHEVILTYNHSSNKSRYIYVYGENITVQGPNYNEPKNYGAGGYINITGLYKGAIITIKGDIIDTIIAFGDRIDNSSYSQYDYYEPWGSSYSYRIDDSYGYDDYSFQFANCRHLKYLYASPRNSELDLSEMPNLKKVVLGNAGTSKVKFSEGQSVEYLKAYQCNNIQQLDLRNISNTLSTVNLIDCDALLGANFKDFKILKTVNLNDCSKMGSINLSGCTSIESFSLSRNSSSLLNVSDCTSLKRLEWTTSLETLIHDGADAIEYVSGGYVSDFNFSGKLSLKQINGLGAGNFDVSGCTNLESMGQIYNVRHINVSDCPLLNTLDIVFLNSADETYKFDNCVGVETAIFKDMGAECDFSSLVNLKKVSFTNMRSKTLKSVDLTANSLLEDVVFRGYNTDAALNNIVLPCSLQNLDISYLQTLRHLDLSEHTNLYSVEIENCRYLYDMNFSGCSMLEYLTLYDVHYYNLYWSGTNDTVYSTLNLSGCSSLKYINKYGTGTDMPYLRFLNLEGCASLEHANLQGASIQSLDFTDCPKMVYLDIRDNDMTKEAIDSMFASLPDWSVDDGFTQGVYMLSGNASGYSAYDKAAANAKNWWSIE